MMRRVRIADANDLQLPARHRFADRRGLDEPIGPDFFQKCLQIG